MRSYRMGGGASISRGDSGSYLPSRENKWRSLVPRHRGSAGLDPSVSTVAAPDSTQRNYGGRVLGAFVTSLSAARSSSPSRAGTASESRDPYRLRSLSP